MGMPIKGLFTSPAAMCSRLVLMFQCIWKSVNVTLMQKYFILKYFSLKKLNFRKIFGNFFGFLITVRIYRQLEG